MKQYKNWTICICVDFTQTVVIFESVSVKSLTANHRMVKIFLKRKTIETVT